MGVNQEGGARAPGLIQPLPVPTTHSGPPFWVCIQDFLSKQFPEGKPQWPELCLGSPGVEAVTVLGPPPHMGQCPGAGAGGVRDPGKGPSTLRVTPPSPSLCCSCMLFCHTAMRDNLSPGLRHRTNYPQIAIS